MMQIVNIADKMKESHLRWFGHIVLLPQDAPVCGYVFIVDEGVKKCEVPKLS